MQRTATAVILKVDVTTHDDEQRTIYYGPFLPHIGGAATGFENEAPVAAPSPDPGVTPTVERTVYK